MPTKKQTGTRCEHLVVSRLLMPGPGPADHPLFNPALLGNNWPTLDIYVEIEGNYRNLQPFFFIQVKGTSRGRDPRSNDLLIQLSKIHTKRLLDMPAPTYLVGVDNSTEEMFIQSVHNRAVRSIPSLRTTFPLDYPTMRQVHQEVLEYWLAFQSKPSASRVQV